MSIKKRYVGLIPLKKINRKILINILTNLENSSGYKKTKLANKCDINYSRLLRYLEFLEAINAIKEFPEEKSRIIRITDNGRKFLERMTD